MNAMKLNAYPIRRRRLTAVSAIVVAACLMALALPGVASAGSVFVSVVGSDTAGNGTLAAPYATIPKALAVATSGTVFVGPGTFDGNVSMATPGVSLRGAGATLTTLRGSVAEAVVEAYEIGAGATVSGFTITGGSDSGILCYLSSPTITENVITGNNASSGGGIYCNHSSPTITHNTIAHNTGNSDGGGILIDSSSVPTITDNVITDNNSMGGGGIECDSLSSPLIAGNTISGNYAADGGGIWVHTSSPRITGNTIVNNVGGEGGGIDCSTFSTPTITGNVVNGNFANGNGGGIASGISSPTIIGDIICGNVANGDGGGVWSGSSTPTITNDVIADNRASNGGGIFLSAAGANVTNDTIAGNVASALGGGIDCASGPQAVTNCIIWDNSSTVSGCSLMYTDRPGLIQIGSHDTSADPHFVAPESGDYRLAAGSPCIDVASSTIAPAADKDGIARPWGAGVDMGAYEYFVPTFHTTTKLFGPLSVKFNKSLSLNGFVTPNSASPYAVPGRVTITMTHKVGRKWKSAGSAKVSVTGDAFFYSFRPKHKGSWHFVASYLGGVVGPTTYLPSKSATKGVTVK